MEACRGVVEHKKRAITVVEAVVRGAEYLFEIRSLFVTYAFVLAKRQELGHVKLIKDFFAVVKFFEIASGSEIARVEHKRTAQLIYLRNDTLHDFC